MIIPADWLPWLFALAAAIVVDQIRFGGKYLNQILNKASGSSFSKWILRPGAHFNGQQIISAEVVGIVQRGNRMVKRIAVITPDSDRMVFDEDNVMIPFHAIKRWNVEPFEITLRTDMQKLILPSLTRSTSQGK
jgi:hypothetical protein